MADSPSDVKVGGDVRTTELLEPSLFQRSSTSAPSGPEDVASQDFQPILDQFLSFFVLPRRPFLLFCSIEGVSILTGQVSRCHFHTPLQRSGTISILSVHRSFRHTGISPMF